MLFISL